MRDDNRITFKLGLMWLCEYTIAIPFPSTASRYYNRLANRSIHSLTGVSIEICPALSRAECLPTNRRQQRRLTIYGDL